LVEELKVERNAIVDYNDRVTDVVVGGLRFASRSDFKTYFENNSILDLTY